MASFKGDIKSRALNMDLSLIHIYLYRPAPESRGSRFTGRSLSVNTPVLSGLSRTEGLVRMECGNRKFPAARRYFTLA